ncbi:hypothetical protein [Parendozoicomonas sp. Alg238-R29]|uniref:hypothetical protein n=1 Tax=Parendozoicomonas sp. Alg238-R29 TaxID=2993446 RepID=UPI00248D74A9|nr:hypothetical protein [Parendozoicomonas sp. Alg238-R29]
MTGWLWLTFIAFIFFAMDIRPKKTAIPFAAVLTTVGTVLVAWAIQEGSHRPFRSGD